jgi:hypothetical protein
MSTLLEQASLVMIPSGYKEDVVFSAIPTDGSGDLSFTRASNGTRVNSAGLVEVCPWNNWTGSNDFSATYWDQYQLTPTTGTTSDIYGNSSTVYKLIGSVTNSYSFINRGSNGSANTAFSVYAKPNGYTKIGISNRSTGDWNFVVDLVTKVVSNIYDPTSAILSINVVDAVGDWKRIEVVGSTAVQYNLHPLPSNFNSTNFDNVTLNGTDGVWVMASQVNIGSTAKPYFPTTDRLNVPRLTYQNGGGGCPSLLLEKQSTNALTYSEDFTQADWPKQNTIVTANATTSPDGTQNADKLIANTTNARHLIFQSITTSNTHTFTTYAKAGENSFLIMRLDTDSPEIKTWFNLSNGTIGTSQGGSPTITSVGNGWYRCSVQYTPSTSSNIYAVLYTAKTDGVEGFAGNDSDGTYIWGAQLEASSYATSYIPTTSASATRVSDACFKTGISSLIGQTEGVAFIDFDFNGNYSSGGIIPFSLDGGAGNELYAWIQTNGTVIFEVYNAFVGQVVISGSIGAVGRKKIAFAYKQNDFAVYLNGTQVGTDTSGTVPTMSRLFVGKYYANDTYNINAGINQTILFPTRLTNAELASLTTI